MIDNILLLHRTAHYRELIRFSPAVGKICSKNVRFVYANMESMFCQQNSKQIFVIYVDFIFPFWYSILKQTRISQSKHIRRFLW